MPRGHLRDGRIGMLILNDGDLFYIEGEAKRMEVERADMERVAFDATIQFTFCIGTQGFIDEYESNAQHQEYDKGSGCEPLPHSMK